MISKMLKIVFGTVLAAGLLLTSDAHPLADKKWTMQDMSIMAKFKTMEDAVSSLTSAAQETGAPRPSLDEIKAVIDGKSAAAIRTAILTATGDMAKRKTKGDKNIADFAKTVNPAATCATEDTAGGHGIGVCVAGCEETSYYLAWTSRKGACYMLCSLAASPCKKESFARKTMESAKSWGTSAIEWIATTFQRAWVLVKIVNAMISSNTKFIVLLLVALANELRDKPEFRKWRVRVFRSETLRALNGRDSQKVKGMIFATTYARLHTKHALFTWHDFAARATYRASQEAAAAKAAKAKAVAVQAAIDAVAAEQGTRDEDGGACVLS